MNHEHDWKEIARREERDGWDFGFIIWWPYKKWYIKWRCDCDYTLEKEGHGETPTLPN